MSISISASSTPIQVISGTSIDINNSNQLILNASGGNGSYYTLRDDSDVQYQVPVGKKLKLLGMEFDSNTSGQSFEIGYGDTATNNGTPTNYTKLHTNGAGADDVVHNSSNRQDETSFVFSVPASKYPVLLGTGSNWSATVIAILEDA